MHHVVIESWARRSGVLHRRDPRLKLLGFLALVVAVAVAANAAMLVGCAAAVLALILIARLPLRAVLLRAALVLPFAATFALISALAGETSRAAALVGKSYLSAAAALALAGTTPLPKLLEAMRQLGVPAFLVTVVQYLYRYLFVISEQAQHMRLAAACRGSLGHAGFGAAAGAVGVLFARSYERAEGIHRAMLSRTTLPAKLPSRDGQGAVLVARGLRYRYDDGTLALDGVDFELHPGETIAVFGPNGSGKTTFAHHLNGLLAGEGSVMVCGVPVEKKSLPEVRRRIGLVFQDSDEQLFMPSVLEDVVFGPLNLGLAKDEAERRAREALARVGIGHLAARAPYHLSAGEKKRAALAGVLVMEPEILVLDEPTTFLDPPAVRGLMELLAELPQAKILVTHDALFARALARRAVFFERGRIAAQGPVDEIIRRFAWDPRKI